MSSNQSDLGKECPVGCPFINEKIETLADFFSVITSVLSDQPYWFRGHTDLAWRLTPSALRYTSEDDRNTALRLLAEFKRVAEIKLDRPPQPDEELKWLQLAQHYGLPTRLLDWTENAMFALYFACQRSDLHGVVFIVDPVTLNKFAYPNRPWVFDPEADATVIQSYLRLKGR